MPRKSPTGPTERDFFRFKIQKMKTKLVLFLAACFAATQVHATWTQVDFHEYDVTFDTIAVYSTSGAGFASPTETYFRWSAPDWTEMYSSSLFAYAQGPATTDMYWDMNFLGSQSAPLSFDFAAWYNGVKVDSASINWNGSNWRFGAVSQERSLPSVPSTPDASSTVILLGVALLGLAGLRRRVAA